MRYRYCFIYLGWLLLFTSPLAIAEDSGPLHHILVIADIHFSPFGNCKNNSKVCPVIAKLNQADASQWPAILKKYGSQQLPKNGENTNYPLIESLMLQIKEQKPTTVLILGDFLAHRYRTQYILYSKDRNRSHYEKFVINTFKFLTQTIQSALPEKTSVYPVVGNNDSYGGKGCRYPDYCVISNGTFLKKLTQAWSPFFKNTSNQNKFKKTFPTAGYYEITLPNTNNKIIAMNSVLFSEKRHGPGINESAKKQLQWLGKKLNNIAAHDQKTWIIFHIPPGVDAYSTAKSFFRRIINFWKEPDSIELIGLTHQYNQQITGVLSGHTHINGFLILDKGDPTKKIIDSSIPSISPILGNNPMYKIYSFDDDSFQLEDKATYSLNLRLNSSSDAEWQQEYLH